jgi:uncharacterized membrane protein
MLDMGNITLLAMAGGLITGIFWMVVGWRAMRAHERLAEAVQRISMHPQSPQR